MWLHWEEGQKKGSGHKRKFRFKQTKNLKREQKKAFLLLLNLFSCCWWWFVLFFQERFLFITTLAFLEFSLSMRLALNSSRLPLDCQNERCATLPKNMHSYAAFVQVWSSNQHLSSDSKVVETVLVTVIGSLALG